MAKAFRCMRCLYEWVRTKDDGEPKACPRCKSYKWMSPKWENKREVKR